MATITLRQLEIFAQIVEHGSFRNCARQIGVSQVAISDHVRQLEQRLGQKLFERVSGGASVLTPAGERVLGHARRILGAIDQLMGDMAGAAPEARGGRRLIIAAHSHIFRYFQEALAKLEVDNPEIGIELDLDTFTAIPLAEKLREQGVDIGFFYALEPPHQFESTLMWHEPLALFAARDHALAHKDMVTASDVLAHPLARLGPDNRLRILIDAALEQAGLGDMRTGTESDNYGLILATVRNGDGLLCDFESSASDLQNLGGLKRIAFEGDLPDIEVRRTIRAPWNNDPVVTKLLAAL